MIIKPQNMKKFYSLSFLILVGITGIQNLNAQENGGGIIYNAPEGTPHLYSRNSIGFYYDWGTRVFGQREGGISIIDGEDGFTYIHNPVAGWATGSYIKGEREGDQIKVKLPQLIYRDTDPETGKIISCNAAIVENDSDNASSFNYRLSDETELIFKISEDGTLSFDFGVEGINGGYPSKLLGMITTEGVFYAGDASQTLTPVDYAPVTPPEGLETSNWELFDFGTGDNHTVTMGFDGNDVYLYNFDNIYARRSWIKGSVDGDIISFPSGQFLGEHNGYFYWYLAADFFETPDTYYFEPKASIDFEYDREKMMMTTQEHASMVANPRKEKIGLDYPEFMWYEKPVIKMITEIPSSYIPQNPRLIGFVDYFQYLGYNYCEFGIYPISIDYDLLDTNNLFFHLYLNGVAEEVFPYAGNFDFPFNYFAENPGTMVVQSFGGNVGLFLMMEGLDTIGIELVYKGPEGEIFNSDIVTYNIETGEVTTEETGGVDELYTGDIVFTEYYDISGHKLQHPQSGLVIRRQHYSSGAIKTGKIILK